ncbi:MAG: sigma-70 family RNA polymerase sigma factor [Chloroflexi bacterium]|nr:sigma-70 family RNA polymerase sigma factor [Chloroflexota bacterium]
MAAPSRDGATSAALPAAFERLFVREYARVAGIAYRVLGDAAEAEDVAQDVFASYYRSHDPEASYAPAWLYKAAAHAALNAVRGRKRRERRDAIAAGQMARVADPEGEAIASEERAEVRAALVRLPERTATLLVLRHSGLTYGEVAATLGIAVDQVGTRLRRAQEAFKKEVLRDHAR